MGPDAESFDRRASAPKKSNRNRIIIGLLGTGLLITSILAIVFGVKASRTVSVSVPEVRTTDVEVLPGRANTLAPRHDYDEEEEDDDLDEDWIVTATQPPWILKEAGFYTARCANSSRAMPFPLRVPKEENFNFDGVPLPLYPDVFNGIPRFVHPANGTRIFDGLYFIKLNLDRVAHQVEQWDMEREQQREELLYKIHGCRECGKECTRCDDDDERKPTTPEEKEELDRLKNELRLLDDYDNTEEALVNAWTGGICDMFENDNAPGFLVGGLDAFENSVLDRAWDRAIGTHKHTEPDTGIFLLASDRETVAKAAMWDCVKTVRAVEDIHVPRKDLTDDWLVQLLDEA